jgi:hypothetical protein
VTKFLEALVTILIGMSLAACLVVILSRVADARMTPEERDAYCHYPWPPGRDLTPCVDFTTPAPDPEPPQRDIYCTRDADRVVRCRSY